MGKKYESKGHIEGPAQVEVSAAIRYLDTGSSGERRRDSNNAVLVIYVTWMFLLSSLALTYLYYEVC